MKGRVALVTGGGRGIGREAALLLAAAGARVVITARSEAELAAVGLEYVVADLGTSEGCAHAVGQTEQRLGPIDLRMIYPHSPTLSLETARARAAVLIRKNLTQGQDHPRP